MAVCGLGRPVVVPGRADELGIKEEQFSTLFIWIGALEGGKGGEGVTWVLAQIVGMASLCLPSCCSLLWPISSLEILLFFSQRLVTIDKDMDGRVHQRDGGLLVNYVSQLQGSSRTLSSA
eukprot:1145545-Pelagomonas_calceolata.AAC.1